MSLCMNKFEHEGGAFGCVLAANHDGAHVFTQAKRTRRTMEPAGDHVDQRPGTGHPIFPTSVEEGHLGHARA